MERIITKVIEYTLSVIVFFSCVFCTPFLLQESFADSDIVGPVIEKVELSSEKVAIGDKLIVTVTVSDESEIDTVTVTYTKGYNGSGSGRWVYAQKQDDGKYTAEIEITDSFYNDAYRISTDAKDIYGNSASSTMDAIFYVGHQWNEEYIVDKEATCTQEGSESIHCSICGTIQDNSSRAIDKKPHAYGEWKTTKEASCSEDGSREKICSDCGDKITETIPATGHQWNKEYTVDKEATCTEEGSESIHCSVCGIKNETTIRVIPAKGHKWNTEYTIDKEATYDATGLKTIHCSVCNEMKPDSAVVVPKLTITVPTLLKPKAYKKSFTAKWNKVSGITGYQVQYALNSKFTKSKKTVKITKAATVSKKVSKLKTKKKYYIRIRAYKTVGGKTYYSAWSKTKTVTTKK